MELFLKISATCLLLVLSHQPVDLQDVQDVQDVPATTDTPGRSIAPSWLRGNGPPKNNGVEWPSTEEQTDQSGGGSASGGYIYIPAEETTNDKPEYMAQPSNTPTTTPSAPEIQNTAPMPNEDVNVTDAKTGDNPTVSESAEETPQNSTNAPDDTKGQITTPAPEKNETDVAEVGSGEGVTNATENNMTTSLPMPAPDATTQKALEGADPTTVSNATTLKEIPPPEATTSSEAIPPPEATTSSEAIPPPEATTSSEAITPPEATSEPETTPSLPIIVNQGDVSDKGADPSDDTAERGFASESERRQRKSAWGAVLGTFVAIAVVGLVAYVILKKKHHKAFSHRKLEEDFPSDPVLRLDNSEPLDLNFGRAAYYNPGLQGDSIQMSPFPKN